METGDNQLHSDEMHDIITDPPSWILKWGVTVFFAVLIIVCGLAFLIRYPDTIATHTVIYAENAVSVNSRSAGIVSQILVANGRDVKQGQPLVFLESGVDAREVLTLIDSLTAWQHAAGYSNANPGGASIAELKKLQARYFELMVQSGAVAGPKYLNDMHTEVYQMLKELNQWKNHYVISAPRTGKLLIAGILQDGLQLKPGEPIFYIQDGNNPVFFGRMAIAQRDIGNISKGQSVLIRLAGFPAEEYGLIKGTIDSVSDLPANDSSFFAHVKLGPVNKRVILKNGLSARSEIVTNDRSLMQRIIANITRGLGLSN